MPSSIPRSIWTMHRRRQQRPGAVFVIAGMVSLNFLPNEMLHLYQRRRRNPSEMGPPENLLGKSSTGNGSKGGIISGGVPEPIRCSCELRWGMGRAKAWKIELPVPIPSEHEGYETYLHHSDLDEYPDFPNAPVHLSIRSILFQCLRSMYEKRKLSETFNVITRLHNTMLRSKVNWRAVNAIKAAI